VVSAADQIRLTSLFDEDLPAMRADVGQTLHPIVRLGQKDRFIQHARQKVDGFEIRDFVDASRKLPRAGEYPFLGQFEKPLVGVKVRRERFRSTDIRIDDEVSHFFQATESIESFESTETR